MFVASRRRVLGFAVGPPSPPAVRLSRLALRPRQIAFHPGGRLCVTVDGSAAIELRDAETLAVARRYDFAMPKLTAVAFSPDGLVCAVGNSRGAVLLFDVEE